MTMRLGLRRRLQCHAQIRRINPGFARDLFPRQLKACPGAPDFGADDSISDDY
jgi:hypothetical protein